MLKLIIATYNQGKVTELRDLLENLPIQLIGLENFNPDKVVETGKDFKENAELKASSYALQTNHWALADDSGLEVPALNGAPGVLSARFAGNGATDDANISKLLGSLAQTSDRQRLARFKCSICISDNRGEIRFKASGICAGRISHTAKGANGFGYDPIFIPDGFDQTFGELSVQIKQKLSHRSMALKKIIGFFSANSCFQT